MATNKRQALGRGLNALLNGDTDDVLELPKIKTTTNGISSSVPLVATKNIEANPFQPRNEFELEALQELAESIQTFGIIQPVTLRKISENKYQLISGERRFRASQMAGLTEIPAYVRTADDQSMLSTVAGKETGGKFDKIKILRELGFNFYPAKNINLLMPEGAASSMECRVMEKIKLGDHTMFAGEVLSAVSNPDRKPLVFNDGKYWVLENRLPKPSAEMKERIAELHNLNRKVL